MTKKRKNEEPGRLVLPVDTAGTELYRVRWDIDVWADNPATAAARARQVQMNTRSTATVFTVVADNGSSVDVDLDNHTVRRTQRKQTAQTVRNLYEQMEDLLPDETNPLVTALLTLTQAIMDEGKTPR